MVSRDTAVHLVAVSLALLVLVVASVLDVGPGPSPAGIAFFVAYNGLIFGGAHLYLAARGEDGMVPTDARWRYVGLLGLLLAAGAISLTVGGWTVGPIELDLVLLAAVAVAALCYPYIETIAGYREAHPE
jgi:hypothetical protein